MPFLSLRASNICNIGKALIGRLAAVRRKVLS
jgi:hypothetical protein